MNPGDFRRFEAEVERTRGILGDISVHYNIKFFTPDNKLSSKRILRKNKGIITLEKGERRNKIVAYIDKNIFLEYI